MYTLMLIDDEPIVLDALRVMVEGSALDLRIIGTASNGEDGLKLILERRPDIVVTDIRMPGMNGLDMIEQAQEELEATGWIVISGYREFDYAKRALLLNVVDYVEKPILRRHVLAALEKAQVEVDRSRERLRDVQATPKPPQQTRNELVNACLTFVNAHYAEEIGLSEAADAVGVNPAYLSGLFKEHTGVSFIKYLTALRLEQAKRLLLDGGKAMQVGQSCGYSEYHYFCRVFKKYTGMSPSEFRESGT